MINSSFIGHICCLGALFLRRSTDNATQNTTSSATLVKDVPGLYLFPNAIPSHLESRLLKLLEDDNDQVPWVDRQSRLTKNYGPHYRYTEWESAQGRMRHCDGIVHHTLLPEWLFDEVMPVLRSLRNDGLGEEGLLHKFVPNQVHVAKYDTSVGHRIGMHNDNRMGVLGEFIVGVCLGGRCDMMFESPEGRKRKMVGLERRCVYVMSGDSHRKWKHGIARGKIQGVRVSLTLREVLSVKTEEGVKLMPKKEERRRKEKH